MRSVVRRTFVTGTVRPIPGHEKVMLAPLPCVPCVSFARLTSRQDRYDGSRAQGRSRKQLERHIVRDSLSWVRRGWAAEREALAAAARAEAAARPRAQSDREERRELKQTLAAEKQRYYTQLEQAAQERRAAQRALRLEYWEKKQQVLAEARQEMVKALVEDEALWEEHPRELMNRRYLTHDGKQYVSPRN